MWMEAIDKRLKICNQDNFLCHKHAYNNNEVAKTQCSIELALEILCI